MYKNQQQNHIISSECQTKYKTILHNKSLGQYYEADGVVQ